MLILFPLITKSHSSKGASNKDKKVPNFMKLVIPKQGTIGPFLQPVIPGQIHILFKINFNIRFCYMP
jgi:hypothetical protein